MQVRVAAETTGFSFMWLNEFRERVKESSFLLPRSTSRVAISVSSPAKASSRKGFLGSLTWLGSDKTYQSWMERRGGRFALLLQGH